ncbi:hypothetical protein B0H16DRAFT_1454509 [Mycena metata]|uniref:Uncharacterized protein n=1 Tax=Mycena metata TaxID=1033252 RepID=A0AAD7NKA9_9AGAR|nr:hypothetical protein B0H16DRAFT_1454509 [Mycena metata]
MGDLSVSIHGLSVYDSHAPTEGEAKVMDFWCRVAQLMTRTRSLSASEHWIGTDELAEWNKRNLATGRAARTCIIEDGYPSCKTCRTAKASCDRKARFLFEYTRGDFYSTMEEFEAVFHSGPPTSMRRHTNAESRTKRKRYVAQTKPQKGTQRYAFTARAPLINHSRKGGIPERTVVRTSCIAGATTAYSPPPSPDVTIPDGIENAREFEEIKIQLEAVDVGLNSIGKRLEKIYVGDRDREAQNKVVRMLFDKLRHLRTASIQPDYIIPP